MLTNWVNANFSYEHRQHSNIVAQIVHVVLCRLMQL